MYNCLDVLIKDLQNHIVMTSWPGHDQQAACYLIMVTAEANTREAFIEFYGEELTPAQLRLAKDQLDDKQAPMLFGVLLDMERKMIYAFDRRFADYDSKKRCIDIKDPDKVLEELTKPAESLSVSALIPEGTAIPAELRRRRPLGPTGGGSMVFRYAFPEIVEATAGNDPMPELAEVVAEMDWSE